MYEIVQGGYGRGHVCGVLLSEMSVFVEISGFCAVLDLKMRIGFVGNRFVCRSVGDPVSGFQSFRNMLMA